MRKSSWKILFTVLFPFYCPHSSTFSILDEFKRNYQELRETSQYEINLISGKIKNAIDLAKPFYECRRQASELSKQLKVDHSNLERAKTNLAAAKEMVFLAEQSVTQVSGNCLIDSFTVPSNRWRRYRTHKKAADWTSRCRK
jgi:SH3 domain-binding protein 5 (SH3BP5)